MWICVHEVNEGHVNVTILLHNKNEVYIKLLYWERVRVKPTHIGCLTAALCSSADFAEKFSQQRWAGGSYLSWSPALVLAKWMYLVDFCDEST